MSSSAISTLCLEVAKGIIDALKDQPLLLVLVLLSALFSISVGVMFREVSQERHEELMLLLDRPEHHRRWSGEPLITPPSDPYFHR